MDRDLYEASLDVCRLLSDDNFARLMAALSESVAAPQLEDFSRNVTQQSQRAAFQDWHEAWRAADFKPSVEAVRCGLLVLRKRIGEEHEIDLVWTGPSVPGTAYRSTEQAIKELISSAQNSLTIVSYTTRDVKALRPSLLKALDRSVSVKMILEHFDAFKQESSENAIRGLGDDVLSRAKIYVWPVDKRTRNGSEVRGSLHSKCLICDSSQLLITSANWTLAAMELNMELGLMMRDAKTIRRVKDQFDSLIESAHLTLWT